MKPRFTAKPLLTRLVTLAVFTASAPLALAASGEPICAPGIDVGHVFGRAAGGISSVHCAVEPKVTAPGDTFHVANVMGNGPRYITITRSEGTQLAARDLRNAPVAWVLGRSGDPGQGGASHGHGTLARSTE